MPAGNGNSGNANAGNGNANGNGPNNPTEDATQSNVTITLGETVSDFPEQDDEKEEQDVEIAEIIQYFHLDEDALKAGRDACLAVHNAKRSLHQETPEMTLEENLTADAQQWAEKIAAGLETGYDPDTICGESIALVPYSSDLTFMVKGDFVSIAELVANDWYNQIGNYDFGTHAKIDANGNSVYCFTQMVWKNSEYLGVGIAKTADGTQVVVVCRYFQKGNISGRRPEFVKPLK
ncbi:Oidioi.mRNA.OKI2018_I69.chr1.g1476.t1.cds [Oikopleura dioica]|uniref:Oidioi.mRNA.OKI2018_I69.chr1.g1476.t1.cds n=1 Tax=Oikopleura dioica TaxID=34765 RepID=A0ABN7SS97_OIKDI|nr:Oidioi.mRNA.OKI2018_I69.chr1.g1476.t1.cds [Oikopleura dioica]